MGVQGCHLPPGMLRYPVPCLVLPPAPGMSPPPHGCFVQGEPAQGWGGWKGRLGVSVPPGCHLLDIPPPPGQQQREAETWPLMTLVEHKTPPCFSPSSFWGSQTLCVPHKFPARMVPGSKPGGYSIPGGDRGTQPPQTHLGDH